ncbi:hypothetical protein [[Mycoplasma] collis]|uniref:hypothetical protein n=1 Tax=[Mycoplasma] collis TaxID=2127 RepID=UPI00051BE2E4|nr:hypothetical protein [[Mycoplasma] collis]
MKFKKTLLILSGLPTTILLSSIALSSQTNYKKIEEPTYSKTIKYSNEFTWRPSGYQLTDFAGILHWNDEGLATSSSLVPAFTYIVQDKSDVVKKASSIYTRQWANTKTWGYYLFYNENHDEWLGANVKLNKLWQKNYENTEYNQKHYINDPSWDKKNIDDGSFAKHNFNDTWYIKEKNGLERWVDHLDIKLKNVSYVYQASDEEYKSKTRNSYFYNNPSILRDIRYSIKNSIIQKYNDEIHLKHNSGDYRIKNLKIKNLNLKVKFKMDFGSRTENKGYCSHHGGPYLGCLKWETYTSTIKDKVLLGDKITEFKIKIDFDFDYQYENVTRKAKSQKLDDYLKNEKAAFNNQFAKTNGTINSLSDSGYYLGINTPKPTEKNTKSNKEYLLQKLQEYHNKRPQEYNGTFGYDIKKSTEQQSLVDFYFYFNNPLNNQSEKIMLAENVKINFSLTEIAKKRNLKNRLQIIPSKYLDLTNVTNGKLVNDVPKQILPPTSEKLINNVYEEYGGK